MRVFASFSFSFFVFSSVVVVGAGCSPFAAKGESCTDDPCAVGLVCIDGVCDEPPPPPPPPCVDDAECAIDGDASGRVCNAGVCEFADCAFDAQCGTRICLDGKCAVTEVCVDDEDCGQQDGVAQLCIDNQCRPPCFADDDCGGAIGGFNLQTCVAGRCQQRCLGDFTCLGGGLCENGACVEPECVDGAECDATEFCDAGRCTAFTACELDDDCFDPNLFCNVDVEPIRCDERPACRADNECGAGALCLDRHCRPAQGCFVDDDCDGADEECVGNRCVRAPECRATADCDGGDICADLRCVEPEDAAAAADVIVEDGLGACDVDSDCRRVVFVGETLTFRTRGFDATGLPVVAEIRADFTGSVSVASALGNVVVVDADSVGSGTVAFDDVVVDVDVVADGAGFDILVTEADGRPASGALVDGVASDEFGHGAVAGGGVVVVSKGGRTAIVPATVDPLRVILPAVVDETRAAALQVSIASTGDETGPVGVGVALPSVAHFKDAGFTRLFGDIVQGQAELPVIGALPVALSSSMTLSATLPLVGDQVVRPLAEVEVAKGPSFVFALEDRREQQDLVALALNGDPIATALDFAEQSEGMDAAIVAGGDAALVDRVADDLDRDGDGDTAELIPDYASAAVVEARPFGPPRQRTSVIARPPAGANERAFVVLGFQLPGRFLVSGTGVVRGATGFEDEALPEPLKLIPQSATVQNVPQVIVVSAVFDDPAFASRAQFVGDRIDAVVDIGPLLDPPEGAFLLRDVPAAGDVSVVLPAIDAALLKLRLTRDDEVIELWAAGDGAVRLPAGFDDVALVDVTAYDVDDAGAVFATGSGPIDVDKVARRVATAPAQ